MERLLWWKLREFNRIGYHFRRQVPILRYFLDFAEHNARVAIELDGTQHGVQSNSRHDAVRDKAIASEGYLVLRFWNNDVRRDLDRVVDVIMREVEARQSPTRNAARFDLPTRGR
jgi:very-short-patch-repair endonuclease